MFADPQTVTVNAVAKVMPRINQDNNTSTYRLRSSTDEYVLSIKHSNGRIVAGQAGEGHVAKIDYTVFATAVLPEQQLACWVVIQNPDGMDLTLVKNISLGLTSYLSGANIDKILNGES
jgi:hypothetical protein